MPLMSQTYLSGAFMIQQGKELWSHASPKNVNYANVHGEKRGKAHVIHAQNAPQG